MGQFLKQSFWTSIFAYLGIAIGYVNSLIIFPAFLSPDQIGLYRQLQNGAFLLGPLAIFGMGATTVRYFPKFSDDSAKLKKFFTLIFIGASIGFLSTFLLIEAFEKSIVSYFAKNAPSVNEYFYIIEILLLLNTFSAIYESFARSNLKIIIPTILKDILVRVLSAISIIAFSMSFLTFHEVINLLLIIYGVRLIFLTLYSRSFGLQGFNFKIDIVSVNALKQMTNFSLFSIIGSAGNVIVLNIDTLMVTGLLGLEATGIYTTAFYIGIVIEMPRRAISQVSMPTISQAFKNKQNEKVKQLYKSISINQMTVGVLLYLGIICNLQSLYSLIPNKELFIAGMPVVYIIGLAKLIDMTFSCNSEIISMSKYYRFNIITVSSLAILTILLNTIFIKHFGLLGAAGASLGAIAVFNLMKWIFIKIKFRYSPFSFNNLKLGLFSVLVYFVIDAIPHFSNAFLDIIVRSGVISITYILGVFVLKLNPEMIELIKNYLVKLKLLK